MPQTKTKPQSIWTWTVSSDSHLLRADVAIQEAHHYSMGQWSSEIESFGEVTRNQIQNLIKNGSVFLNHSPLLKPNQKLKTDDQIEIHFMPAQELDLTPVNLPLDILYEDESLIVINKPQGMAVHPSSSDKDPTLVHGLLYHIKDLGQIGDKIRPGIVHRIDKNTSGALVVAKTQLAHQKLIEDFSKHQIQRVYWALCFGSPGKKINFSVESLIGRSPNERIKMSMNVKTGKNAISHFKLIEEFKLYDTSFASWIEATLETGRTHQIRVHLTSESISILGDPLYGKPTLNQKKWKILPKGVKEQVTALTGQALHARTLGFSHPVSRKKLLFEAKPPQEFDILLKELQKYSKL